RVYYTTASPQAGGNRDPDAFHRGIAPAVKLLYEVVARIAELNNEAALPFLDRWRLAQSPIHTRLWAAAARNPILAGSEQTGAFVVGLEDRQFWDLSSFPEI